MKFGDFPKLGTRICPVIGQLVEKHAHFDLYKLNLNGTKEI